MRPVNLIPEDQRARTGPSANPVPAYAVVGVLATFVVMMLGIVMFSNQITTAEDETKAANAEAQRYQVSVPAAEPFADFGDAVSQRTLLIGGLSEARFPWHIAMFNLARVLPSAVTLDSFQAAAGGSSEGAATPAAATAAAAPAATPGATATFAGCATSHDVVAQLLVRLRAMPGVADATLESSTRAAATATTPADQVTANRTKNCGKRPTTFSLTVIYDAMNVDLSGLPKPEAPPAAAGATTPTTVVPAVGTPTAAPAG